MSSPLTAEKYLSTHYILIYLEDAICQLLEQKEENSKVNPAKFFADYFNGIKRGTHTLFREFRFVAATPYNRACFTHTFWKCFRYIGKKQDLLQVREYHALLSLLCFDFPYEIVQKTARIILMDDALDCLMSFPDFIYAFQVQFYFNEFLCKCADVFNKLLSSPHSPRETVVVPTETTEGKNNSPTHGKSGSLPERAANASDTVDAQLFLKSLVSHCEKAESFSPLPNILREILLPLQRVSFYGFVMALVQCESLNSSIGKLPPKVKLLDYADADKDRNSTNQSQPINASTQRVANGKAAPSTLSRYAGHGAQSGVIPMTTTSSSITSSKANLHVTSKSSGKDGCGPLKMVEDTEPSPTIGFNCPESAYYFSFCTDFPTTHASGPPPPAPSSSSTGHGGASRLHTPVSMSQSRRSSNGVTTVQRIPAKGTAVGGSAEALESGVGTESAVDTTDSGQDDPSSDDSETSEDN